MKVVWNLFFMSVVMLEIGCISLSEEKLSQDTYSEFVEEFPLHAFEPVSSTAEYYEYSEQNVRVRLENLLVRNDGGLFSIGESAYRKVLFFKRNGRIGHFIDDSQEYNLSFKCISGTLSIERYIDTDLPTYDVIECSGQVENFKISRTYFLELSTMYIDSSAKIANINFDVL